MNIERRAGRVVGALFIAQMVGSFLVNFWLEAPLFGEPGSLVNAAPHALQIGISALAGIKVPRRTSSRSTSRARRTSVPQRW